MLTFALVLILNVGGQAHAYTLDSGLSYQDCQIALAANAGQPGKLVCEAE